MFPCWWLRGKCGFHLNPRTSCGFRVFPSLNRRFRIRGFLNQKNKSHQVLSFKRKTNKFIKKSSEKIIPENRTQVIAVGRSATSIFTCILVGASPVRGYCFFVRVSSDDEVLSFFHGLRMKENLNNIYSCLHTVFIMPFHTVTEPTILLCKFLQGMHKRPLKWTFSTYILYYNSNPVKELDLVVILADAGLFGDFEALVLGLNIVVLGFSV